MTRSKRDKLKFVLNRGQIVLTMTKTDEIGVTARLYRNSESRGYQTDFQLRPFFYIISFHDGVPVWIEAVTKDARRKNIVKHLTEQSLDWQIVNQESFDLWVNS